MEKNGKDEPFGIVAAGAAALRRASRLPLSGAERWLARRFLAAVGDPPVRMRFWDGSQVEGAAPIRAVATLQDRAALWRLMTHPSLALGEQYAEGGIDIEGDLVEFMNVVLAHIPKYLDSRFLRAWSGRGSHNSLARSRENIHHHYDIGNRFYELWLDREMAYTCAYFPEPSAELEAAQFAKMELVCRKMALRPHETVVEAGCGWGGLSRHMARHFGVRVKAYNISREQVAYARERAVAEGLADRIDYVEEDYRNIAGDFDAFVSVGMLEHVGVENYAALGRVIDRCLKPHGRGLIHTIAQNHAEPLGGFIEKYIFPGAYPPTLREMMAIFEPCGFMITDVENLRQHYGLTLAHWLERFERHLDQVRHMFDERFVRAWRLYLASSQASFETGRLQLFQVVFGRNATPALPMTRAGLYRHEVV